MSELPLAIAKLLCCDWQVFCGERGGGGEGGGGGGGG